NTSGGLPLPNSEATRAGTGASQSSEGIRSCNRRDKQASSMTTGVINAAPSSVDGTEKPLIGHWPPTRSGDRSAAVPKAVAGESPIAPNTTLAPTRLFPGSGQWEHVEPKARPRRPAPGRAPGTCSPRQADRQAP